MSLLINPYTYAPAGWDAAWTAAWNRQESGAGQAHVACFGDSVTQGFFGGVPYYTQSWPGQMQSRIAGVTTVEPGTGWVPIYEETTVTDDRTSRTGTWTSTGTWSLFGIPNAAQAGATFTFGPVTCSSFRVMYAQASGGGAWTATVDGGTPENFTSAGSGSIQVATIDAGGHGSHTLVLAATGVMYPVAIEAIANPTEGVKVSRVANSGKKASELIADASGFSSRQCYLAMGDIDLAIVGFGYNEAFGDDESAATFKTNLGSLIDDLQGMGASVVILIEPDPNPTHINDWADYRAVMLELVDEKTCGVIDLVDTWGSWAAIDLPYMHDNVHPNPAGHIDIGRLAANVALGSVGAIPAVSWLPTDLGSLALWLDASDEATFTYSSGSLVSEWRDKSGAGRHFSQATATNQPTRNGSINGKAAVTFDGIDDVMGAGDVLDLGTSNLTIYVVAKLNLQTGNGSTILGKYKVSPLDGSYVLLTSNTGGNSFAQLIYDPGTITAPTGATNLGTAVSVVGAILDRATGSAVVRLDSADDASTSFTPDSAVSRDIPTGLWLGALRNSGDSGFQALYWLNGIVAEVVVCLGALSGADRANIEEYLSVKWQV